MVMCAGQSLLVLSHADCHSAVAHENDHSVKRVHTWRIGQLLLPILCLVVPCQLSKLLLLRSTTVSYSLLLLFVVVRFMYSYFSLFMMWTIMALETLAAL